MIIFICISRRRRRVVRSNPFTLMKRRRRRRRLGVDEIWFRYGTLVKTGEIPTDISEYSYYGRKNSHYITSV